MKKLTLLFVALLSVFGVVAQETTPINVFDAESGEIHMRFRALSSESLSIVDNPLKNDNNSSDKVMLLTPFVDEGYTVPNNRCILMIDMVRNQADEDVLYTYGYTNVKLKYYSPSVRSNEIKMQWNASTTLTPLSLFPEGGKWETLDFEFPYDDEDYSTFQIIMNENKSWAGTDFLMYIDDIVVYNKNATGFESVTFSNLNGHSYNKNGQTFISLQSKEMPADISVQLYSMSGQKLKDLYHGAVAGVVDIPINETSGMYIVQISNGKSTKAIKLIVK